MTRGLKLHIDLDAVRHNYQTLQSHIDENCRMSVAVKADAYGLGVDKLAPFFHELGCRDFFVARIGEAVELKSLIPNDSLIYIFDGLTSVNDAKTCREHGFIPVINSLLQAELAGDLPVALHFDTGMNRLGLPLCDLSEVGNKPLNIKIILTHAASADVAGSTQTAEQFKRFQTDMDYFPDAQASFANSAASLSNTDWHLNMIRPGIALYGGESLRHAETDIKDVVTLSAPILQIRQIKAEETVGYGASYTADHDMTIATVSIGYADGFFRSLSNTGYTFVKNKKCDIIGRVSMDLITIDISHIANEITANDIVEIIGPNITLEEFAKNAGTIGYEVLTRLGKSMEKCYSKHSRTNKE